MISTCWIVPDALWNFSEMVPRISVPVECPGAGLVRLKNWATDLFCCNLSETYHTLQPEGLWLIRTAQWWRPTSIAPYASTNLFVYTIRKTKSRAGNNQHGLLVWTTLTKLKRYIYDKVNRTSQLPKTTNPSNIDPTKPMLALGLSFWSISN